LRRFPIWFSSAMIEDPRLSNEGGGLGIDGHVHEHKATGHQILCLIMSLVSVLTGTITLQDGMI